MSPREEEQYINDRVDALVDTILRESAKHRKELEPDDQETYAPVEDIIIFDQLVLPLFLYKPREGKFRPFETGTLLTNDDLFRKKLKINIHSDEAKALKLQTIKRAHYIIFIVTRSQDRLKFENDVWIRTDSKYENKTGGNMPGKHKGKKGGGTKK